MLMIRHDHLEAQKAVNDLKRSLFNHKLGFLQVRQTNADEEIVYS